MKNLKDICLVIQARLGSQRCPSKMIKPFAGTTLFDIALEKANKCIIPNEQVFVSVYEPELKEIASKYDVQIFERSEKSANSEGEPITEIFEWWDKLPGKYVVMVNACAPMLTVKTIDKFINNYQRYKTNGAFGVTEKRNIYWINKGNKHFNPYDPIIDGYSNVECLNDFSLPMNTKIMPSILEAVHVLYAGAFEDIGNNIWMGDLQTGEGITFMSIPEEECLDIDYPWQFEAWEQVYKLINQI